MNTREPQSQITNVTKALRTVRTPRPNWWNLALRPYHQLSTLWRQLKPKVRLVLRVVACILVAAGVVTGLVWLALQWKSGQSWEDFLQKFVTSPAAAGTAAVVAAIIAATTFNRGLQQTKSEARDKAWWEKFEWVTDRIVPKDPKQERLASGLAFSLLGSLEDSSAAGFQRDAVEGIKQTYIQGRQTDLSSATPGELRAQLREVQTFADSSWHSGTVSSDIRSYAYRLATAVALREAWDAEKVELDPTFPLRPKPYRRETITALLKYRDLSAIVVTRYTAMPHFYRELPRYAFERNEPLMELNKVGAFIVVTNREVPEDRDWLEDLHAVGVVYWENEHGAEALRNRIQQALYEINSLNDSKRDYLQSESK